VNTLLGHKAVKRFTNSHISVIMSIILLHDRASAHLVLWSPIGGHSM
jgi:hypothetical protein